MLKMSGNSVCPNTSTQETTDQSKMHQASPQLQAIRCAPSPALRASSGEQSPEQTSLPCPLAACASREQKACQAEPPPSDRQHCGGCGVTTSPLSPSLLQLPCLQVKGTITVTFVPSGLVRSFQKAGMGRTFSEACILLCSLTFKLSECQVKIQISLQKVLYPWVEKYKIKITL